MAIRQYYFQIECNNDKNLPNFKKKINELLHCEYCDYYKSWLYWDIEGTCILIDDEDCWNIQWRFDLRNINKDLIHNIFSIVTECGFVFIIKSTIRNIEELKESIIQSNACKFVTDPIEFLSNI